MDISVLAGVLTRQCNSVIARHEAISLPASMDISVLAGVLTRQCNFVIARHEAISLPMFSRQPSETSEAMQQSGDLKVKRLAWSGKHARTSRAARSSEIPGLSRIFPCQFITGILINCGSFIEQMV
jgi:hypothetical protein